ncbi:glycosyltransferase family 2 protein [Mucilaginibacter sp. OK283]|jgi:rhamnosyltransferase|uniref:glycosyltransferase family 2 protein n=1 Tax=Mucilaginibacter sp. OK283 TaxID=1881049 RepID=UPI0008D66FA5|nr:glycosyltransferase family 2 protein [Mucilaginibacter sp. OK283]SEO12079.1 rhamnosyltransferase [Mucilaginibacter sp. OK283]
MIAGCVVLYNPDDKLIENILSYRSQLDELFVVDNSTHNTSALQEKLKKYQNITYINNKGNQGIAHALNTGAIEAERKNYKWLLTMDQDSRFINHDFFALMNEKKDESIGIYAASYTNNYDRWILPYSENFNDIHFVITSGNLLNLNAWRVCGKFEEKLFIDEVDHDFCLKLRTHNYKILTSKKIFIVHSVGEEYIKSNKRPIKALHPPLRYYYIARNGFYIVKKYFFSDFKFAFMRCYYLLKCLIKIIVCYPDKRKYFKYFLEGIRDFIKSKYGIYGS